MFVNTEQGSSLDVKQTWVRQLRLLIQQRLLDKFEPMISVKTRILPKYDR